MRPILTHSNAIRRESGAQTDISAIPGSAWRSESSLANKVCKSNIHINNYNNTFSYLFKLINYTYIKTVLQSFLYFCQGRTNLLAIEV